VTHRLISSAFAVTTGRRAEQAGQLDWEALARIPTLVVLMGWKSLPAIAERLIAHGADPAAPAAVISCGTTPEQRVALGTLSTIAEATRQAGLVPPATLVVGEVARLAARLAWFRPAG
ncbi:MAG TPA: SAM-dependent methyltransferase, partial [Limnochordales bacterium]